MAVLSVLRLIPMGVFGGATFPNIGRAFDLACKELNDAGQARRGERYVKRLRDAGLTGLRKPSHRIVGAGGPDSGATSTNRV